MYCCVKKKMNELRLSQKQPQKQSKSNTNDQNFENNDGSDDNSESDDNLKGYFKKFILKML